MVQLSAGTKNAEHRTGMEAFRQIRVSTRVTSEFSEFVEVFGITSPQPTAWKGPAFPLLIAFKI